MFKSNQSSSPRVPSPIVEWFDALMQSQGQPVTWHPSISVDVAEEVFALWIAGFNEVSTAA